MKLVIHAFTKEEKEREKSGRNTGGSLLARKGAQSLAQVVRTQLIKLHLDSLHQTLLEIKDYF